MAECLSCRIVQGQQNTVGDVIAETTFFHAHQDFAYPVPGLVIVASKRHFKCLDELTEEEAEDFIRFTVRIRKAQRDVLDAEHVYYFYNEDTRHHFHLWMVPRYEWMGQFGRSVHSLRPALVHARDTMTSPEELTQVADVAKALNRLLEQPNQTLQER